MKRTILFITFAALLVTQGMADSLTWEYIHGWTKGHVVTINDDKGTITLHDRNDDTKKVAEIINAKNILLYIGELLKRIPEDGAGQAAVDGERNTLELTTKVAVTRRIVYTVDPPGGIVLNADYPAAKELEEAQQFRESIDGFLVREALFSFTLHDKN